MTHSFRRMAFFPLLGFLLISVCLVLGIYWQRRALPSTFINHPSPKMNLPSLVDPYDRVSNRNWQGNMILVNVWATWCVSCRIEHPFLMQLAQQSSIPIYGVDYKDGRRRALRWLKRHGNPYAKIAFDAKGQTAIDWGVYGTPETFLIDRRGYVRYKHVGVITPKVWHQEFLPVIRKYSV